MLTYLRQLVSEREALTGLATNLAERAATESRDLTEPEQAQIRGWQERCVSLDAQITEHNSQVESQRAFAALQSRLHESDDDDGTSRQLVVRERTQLDVRTWGQIVTDSPEVRSYTGHGTTPMVEVPFETRATDPGGSVTPTAVLTGPIVTGGGLSPVYHSGARPNPAWTTPLLDVVGHERVSSGSVDYLVWTPNPPSLATVVAETDLKPEATMSAALVAKTLATYAHWKAVSRQALEDIPRVQSIIEGRLRQGLLLALEGATATAIGAATFTTPTPVPATGGMMAALRSAMAVVQAAGYTPNAAVLNPADWATLDMAALNARFGAGIVSQGQAWGLRLIASTLVPAGTAYVGDFATAVTLFERGTANVFMSDSHQDYFIRNTFVILAEARALPAVVEQAAIQKITGTSP